VSPRFAVLGALVALTLAASSCAYYNTFYLARKYYDVAAARQPYVMDRVGAPDNQNFNKSIDYAKKVLSQYPKSKWVDDAYLLWARGLLGKDDPGQTIAMLQDFATRYPNSTIKADAKFYLGVAYRQYRKPRDAARVLQDFLDMAPKHDLVPYALIERARALTSLQEYDAAALTANQLIARWPKSELVPQAGAVRAEAFFKNSDYSRARVDFHALGQIARTDEDRLTFLLREADCLEAAKSYDEELALLKDAQSHEPPPPTLPEPVDTPTTTNAIQSAPPQGQANDHWGRLTVRIATVAVLQGDVRQAVTAYHGVVRDYPHTPLAAEAQFRIGYAYETAADDFERARAEYAKVRDIASSAFVSQAATRLANLDRIAKFHSTTKDTVEAKAEAGFLLAEQYLFQIDKPERALEQYHKIEQDFAGTPWAAKAIVAQAWVLNRKLDRKAEGDSLFWLAVREHPATDAQLAARDYLEMEGAEVPSDLIRLPERQLAMADTTTALTPVPDKVAALGSAPAADTDSLGHRVPAAALVTGAALMGAADPSAVGPPAPAPLGPPAPFIAAPIGGSASAGAATSAGAAASATAAAGTAAGAAALPSASPPVAGAAGVAGPTFPDSPAGPAVAAGARPARDSLATAPRDTAATPAGPRKP
jgi:TolA-binding protein